MLFSHVYAWLTPSVHKDFSMNVSLRVLFKDCCFSLSMLCTAQTQGRGRCSHHSLCSWYVLELDRHGQQGHAGGPLSSLMCTLMPFSSNPGHFIYFSPFQIFPTVPNIIQNNFIELFIYFFTVYLLRVDWKLHESICCDFLLHTVAPAPRRLPGRS